jgi:nitrile hydratase
MTEAVAGLLVEKGIVGADELRATLEAIDAKSPADGARLVARAWVDAGFRDRLLADVAAAAAELGIDAGATRSAPSPTRRACTTSSSARSAPAIRGC